MKRSDSHDRRPPTDPGALPTYIHRRYLDLHSVQSPDAAALALKVERVHADGPEVQTRPAVLLKRMIGALEVHMKKEDLILFPAIRRGGMPGIENPIAMMRSDHDDHEAEAARFAS